MKTVQAPVLIQCESAHKLYLDVLHALSEGEEVDSVVDPNSVGSGWGNRNRPTKELRYATLVLENPKDRLINAPTFHIEDAVPRAILCTLSDEFDVSSISFYNPKACQFSDDGKTVPSSYGHRIRFLDNTNQIEHIIDHLKKDPNSRRAVIHIHKVGDTRIRYAPCINSLHFLIRNGALECQTLWRSENALTILPTNLFEFTLFQELIASELGIPVGKYVHTVSSLHYYLDDQPRFDQVLEIMSFQPPPEPMETMTEKSLEQVDLIREFERKLRLGLGNGKEEFSKLSNYWKQIAKVFISTIEKKLD